MSYKITDAKFLNQKIAIQKFDFETDNKEITQILINSQKEKQQLNRIFKGKEQIRDGRFLIDNLDLVNPKFVKNRASFIKTDTFIERFIPSRVILVLSSLFNPKFVRDARIHHLRTKYDYLSFLSSKENLTDYRLKTNLDKVISTFISDESRIEEKVLKEFEQQLNSFNKKQSNLIFGRENSVLKVVARSYYREKVRLETYNLDLTFFQVLWDNVNRFDSLRNSCTCEYNAKKSSNKEIKKTWRELNYNQTKYVVKKQLKYLAIKITEYRTKIYRQSRLVNQMYKQFKIEFKKFTEQKRWEKEKISDFQKTLNNWKKLNDDQIDAFITSQQNYFFNKMTKNVQYIAKVLVVKIHKYHEQVLAKNLKYRQPGEFKKNKKYYRSKISGIFKQSLEYNEELMQKFGISMEWFLKSTFKLSSLNILFVKIIRAINMNRNNIFLMDFVHLFNQSDFDKLIKTINKIIEQNHKVSFTILDSHANRLPFLDQRIFVLNNSIFGQQDFGTLMQKEPSIYRDSLLGNKNLFRYEYEDGILKIYNVRIQKTFKNLPERGYAFINPFRMAYLKSSTDKKPNSIDVITNIREANNFNDPYMHYCKNDKGYKFYFYDYEKNDLKDVEKGIINFNFDDALSEFI